VNNDHDDVIDAADAHASTRRSRRRRVEALLGAAGVCTTALLVGAGEPGSALFAFALEVKKPAGQGD
jgi:hypothetical protein